MYKLHKNLFINKDSAYDVNILIGENGSGKSIFLNDFAKESIKSNENVIAISTSVHDKFNVRSDNFNFFGARQGRNMINKIIKKSLISKNDTENDEIKKFIHVLEYVGYSSRIGIKVDGFNPRKLDALKIDGVISRDDKYDLISLLDKYHNVLLDKKTVSIDLYAFTSGRINASALSALLRYETIMKKLNIIKNIRLVLEKNDQEIELKNASSGELLILSTLTFISSFIKPNSIILIDEPENSLHPKWQREYVGKILDLFYYYQPKIILATHSPIIIPLESQPIKLFSIENGSIKKVERKTSNNEELLSDIFNIVTPENRYLSDHMIEIINKFDLNEITLSVANKEIDLYIRRVYDPRQKEFLLGVKNIINNIHMSKKEMRL